MPPDSPFKPFRLTDSFLSKYHDRKPPFGFNGFGELVYLRTYSRVKDNGANEVWWETVRRVVEGTYNMQKRHILASRLSWSENKAQWSAQEMYERMFSMKFLPPGRGLWAMGSPLTEEKGIQAALFNCAFVSTDTIATDFEKPFTFLMDGSMLGIGVGFDIKGAGKITVKGYSSQTVPHQISDDREGWVESTGRLIRNGLCGGPKLEIDYSLVRASGLPIKGFGGLSCGPEPLRALHENLVRVLENNAGGFITGTTIVDIMNMIGCCVVAGNVRRTAEIVFGPPDDDEYLKLKDYRWNNETSSYQGSRADRAGHGWSSNNSIFAEIGMDYAKTGDQAAQNGEPGFAWLENMRRFGRMHDEPNSKDSRVQGGNPCLEQSLESYECCNLVETFIDNHTDLDDYKRTLKFAYLYAKTVTLSTTPWPEANQIMLRNRRIGCSMSGIQQFVAGRGVEILRLWCDEGYNTLQRYDEVYSEWFCIPRSVKTTSIKPSGTVSILAGATPGMHWPESLYYIRRMRLALNSDLVKPLKRAGYKLEPCVGQEDSTLVVEVPIALNSMGGRLRSVHEVSMWEQLSMAAFLQAWWADNQVSCTVTFDPSREGPQIKHALGYYQYQLKGISFLPRAEAGVYAQMPYEAITQEEYHAMAANLKPLNFASIHEEQAEIERFCDGDHCTV